MSKWYGRPEIQGGLREVEITKRIGEPSGVIVETTNGRDHSIGYTFECGCELRGGNRYVYCPCERHADVPEEMDLIDRQVPKGYDAGVGMTNGEAHEKLGWPTIPNDPNSSSVIEKAKTGSKEGSKH